MVIRFQTFRWVCYGAMLLSSSLCYCHSYTPSDIFEHGMSRRIFWRRKDLV